MTNRSRSSCSQKAEASFKLCELDQEKVRVSFFFLFLCAAKTDLFSLFELSNFLIQTRQEKYGSSKRFHFSWI